MTPQLRFPQFTDEWQDKKLGYLCDMKAGKFVSAQAIKSEKISELYPCYGGNGLRGYVDSYNHSGNYSLVGRQGALCGNVNYASGEFYATEHALVVYPESDINSKWLYYQLKRLNLNRFATGQAQPGLSVDTILAIKQSNPSQELEQEKIAEFLTTVDERIEKIEKKLELLQQYKKGVMQKIFTQQIRFKDEADNSYPKWQEKLLGDIFTERLETNSNESQMLSVTINHGIVLFNSINRKDNSNADKSRYKTVKVGDIAYNSMRMWQGASGVSVYDGIVSPAYTVVTANSQNSSNFWGYYFKLPKMVQTFERHSQGLTSDTWNLKYTALSKIKTTVPILEEQQKIANFLTTLDDKIKSEQTRLTATKQWKKGILQRMFV